MIIGCCQNFLDLFIQRLSRDKERIGIFVDGYMLGILCTIEPQSVCPLIHQNELIAIFRKMIPNICPQGTSVPDPKDNKMPLL